MESNANENFQVINLSAHVGSAEVPKMEVNRQGWIDYGKDNLFPQKVLLYNSRSPVNTSILESKVTYICGRGVRDTAVTTDGYVGRPNGSDTWDDIVERVATDYATFGGYYLQIIRNRDSSTVSVFHQDFAQVRIGKIDAKGHPVNYKIARDWTKTTGKGKPIELPVFDGFDKMEIGEAYIYAYFDYRPNLLYYCVPNYWSAARYVKADGALSEFYDNAIENGFTPSVVITQPSNPTDEVKAEFQKKMESKFTGARGACRVLIIWGESTEQHSTVTPFTAANNADTYNNIEGIIFQKLISAHRLSSPTLAGVSGSGNLSGNAAEIIDAYILFNYTVIDKMRRRILDGLNIFQKINKLAPLQIQELEVLPRIAEANGTPQTTNDSGGAALSAGGGDGKLVQTLKKILGVWK